MCYLAQLWVVIVKRETQPTHQSLSIGQGSQILKMLYNVIDQEPSFGPAGCLGKSAQLHCYFHHDMNSVLYNCSKWGIYCKQQLYSWNSDDLAGPEAGLCKAPDCQWQQNCVCPCTPPRHLKHRMRQPGLWAGWGPWHIQPWVPSTTLYPITSPPSFTAHRYLQKKIADCLCKFHAEDFPSLNALLIWLGL